MAVYITLIILSVLFTWLQEIGILKNGMKISYFLVFLFLGLRHDYGNDYSGYLTEYLNLKSLKDDSFYFKGNEFGWLYLNYFFKSVFGDFGFHLMLAFIGSLSCFSLYYITRKYVSPKYYTFSIALLLLEPENILVLSSGIRQATAVAIFLLSFRYLMERKYLHYTAGLLFASLFHTSVLVFIPLIGLNIVNWRIYVPYVFLVLIGMFALLNNQKEFFKEVDILLETQESVYTGYTKGDFASESSKFGLGFAVVLFLNISALIINRKAYRSIEQYTIVKVVIIILFLSVIGIAIQIAGRLGFYVFPILVIAYTLTFVNLKRYYFGNARFITPLLTLIILVFYAYKNYLFWQSPVYSPFFINYHTLFQSPLW